MATDLVRICYRGRTIHHTWDSALSRDVTIPPAPAGATAVLTPWFSSMLAEILLSSHPAKFSREMPATQPAAAAMQGAPTQNTPKPVTHEPDTAATPQVSWRGPFPDDDVPAGPRSDLLEVIVRKGQAVGTSLALLLGLDIKKLTRPAGQAPALAKAMGGGWPAGGATPAAAATATTVVPEEIAPIPPRRSSIPPPVNRWRLDDHFRRVLGEKDPAELRRIARIVGAGPLPDGPLDLTAAAQAIILKMGGGMQAEKQHNQ